MLTRLRGFANRLGANSCALCGLKKVAEVGLCDDCAACLPRWHPHPVQHLATQHQRLYCDNWFAPLRWQPLTQQLIHRYKEQRQLYLSVTFAHLIAAHILVAYHTLGIPLPELLVAMPSSRKRWRHRGFHPVGRMAMLVGQLLDIEYRPGALKLLKAIPQQKRQNQWQRWQSAKGSQYAVGYYDAQSIALIDDVISTGATLAAAASALKKAGAGQVHGWALIYNQGG